MRLPRTSGQIALALLLGCQDSGLVDAQLPPLARSCPGPSLSAPPIVIEGATVLDMMSSEARPGTSVLVRDGRIVTIGSVGTLDIPEGTLRIDGRRWWLMPGLVDGHTHERPALPGWPDDAVGNMWLYLANGITTIANMGEHSGRLLGLRDSIRTGVVMGPRIFAGHFARGAADGGPTPVLARDPDEARALVRRAKEAGYDYLKVYSQVPRAAYDALISEASSVSMLVTGHIPAEGGFANVASNAMSNVQHAVEVWYRALGGTGLPGEASLAGVLASFKSSGMFLTPTVHAVEMYAAYRGAAWRGADPMSVLDAVPGLEYLHPAAEAVWRAQVRSPAYSAALDMGPTIQAQEAITRALAAGGVPLIAGSDNLGVAGNVPGYSLLEELAALSRLGLSGREVLRAATRAPGEWLAATAHSAPELGIIKAGARADLLLLDGDPTERLDLLRRPAGVVTAGRWLDAACLTASLDSLRRARRGR